MSLKKAQRIALALLLFLVLLPISRLVAPDAIDICSRLLGTVGLAPFAWRPFAIAVAWAAAILVLTVALGRVQTSDPSTQWKVRRFGVWVWVLLICDLVLTLLDAKRTGPLRWAELLLFKDPDSLDALFGQVALFYELLTVVPLMILMRQFSRLAAQDPTLVKKTAPLLRIAWVLIAVDILVHIVWAFGRSPWGIVASVASVSGAKQLTNALVSVTWLVLILLSVVPVAFVAIKSPLLTSYVEPALPASPYPTVAPEPISSSSNNTYSSPNMSDSLKRLADSNPAVRLALANQEAERAKADLEEAKRRAFEAARKLRDLD